MSNIYFDKLDEQDDKIGLTHSNALEVLSLLEELITSIDKEDEKTIDILKNLQTRNDKLLKNIVDCRVVHVNASELRVNTSLGPNTQITKSILFLSPEDRDDPDNLFNYFEEVKMVQEAWMRHVSLLANLSDELVHKLESQDQDNKVIVNSDPLPKDLKTTLQSYDDFGDHQERTEELRMRLFQYLDNIKTGRVKYALENKYLLNTALQKLTKDVSAWSQRWSSIENMLFGDSATSLKRLIQKTEEVRAMLFPDSFDSDVNMDI